VHQARNTLVATVGAAFTLAALSGSAVAANPPVIEGESVSHITSTDATLEARINVQDAIRGAYYQFQLVTDPSEYGPTPFPLTLLV
jgi:hypothetical protein